MFAFMKRGAYVSELSAALHKGLAPLQIKGGIPGGFWRDPFCAGYMIGVFGVLAKVASRGALRGEELGRVGFGSFEKAFGHNGLNIYRYGVSLAGQNDIDFEHGVNVGTMIAVVTLGGKAFDDNPTVRRIRYEASQMPDRDVFGGEHAAVVYLMTEELFMEEIKKRFD